MQHNPSNVYHIHDNKNHNNHVDGGGDDNNVANILQQNEEHLLWHKEANELIKHFPQRRQHQRHSTGVIYTHPSAIAMLTLSKRASDGLTIGGNSGELLSTRQRHQRDLFSGDLVGFQSPIIPPAPINFQKSFSIPTPPPPPPQPPKRTHVGNVVNTFEAMAMQRNLPHQQQQKYDIFKQKETQQQSFSKYIKNSTKRLTKLKWQTSPKQQQQQQKVPQISMPTITKIKPEAHAFYKTTPLAEEYSKMPIIITRERKTFNECNKQIAQHYHHQMELDYRKNLFSTKPHVNILNFTTTTTTNNNHNQIYTTTKQKWQKDREREAEGEDVIVNFDEMLAGYTATDDNNDDDDDDGVNDNDDYDNNNYVYKEDDAQNYSTHVSVINISGNEAQDNALRINLNATNDKQMASEQSIKLKIKQQLEQKQKQLLPIIRKKAKAPAPPSKTKKIRENKSLLKSHLCEKRIYIPLTTATTKAILNKRSDEVADSVSTIATTLDNSAASKIIATYTNDNFLRGTTLSQSFVRQFQWKKIKNQHLHHQKQLIHPHL